AAVRDLSDRKPEVRLSAVRDLARWAGDAAQAPGAAIAALERALVEDGQASVRAEAALALADAAAASAVPSLLRAAEQDASARVRQLAVLALGELGEQDDERIGALVAEALDDAAPELRFQALIALHRLAPALALPKALQKLSDSDRQIRYIALRIVDEILTDSAVAAPPIAELRARLEDTAPEVRLAAAIALTQLGDHSGVDQLVAALNERRPIAHDDDEQAVVELAGELGLVAARPGLERRAWGWFGRARPGGWQARVALARLGDERAQARIVRDLGSKDRDTRTAAIVAAARARLQRAQPLIAAMRGDELAADPETVAEALAAFER